MVYTSALYLKENQYLSFTGDILHQFLKYLKGKWKSLEGSSSGLKYTESKH